MNQKLNILFLSTYPPRACGIATFTQDLVGELVKTGAVNAGIVAINDAEYSYPPEVRFTLDQQEPDSYRAAAEKINRSGADLLVVEHEYGIYGGKYGKYLLNLTENLKLPFVVTLHTVLPEPEPGQKEIIGKLAEKCRRIITMASNTVPILEKTYGVSPEKIEVIPHGVPNFPVRERSLLKKQAGLDGRFIVSTFGLISPGKGLEYGIEAVAQVVKRHPEILYLILGQTHPVIKREYGEKYREKLEQAVENYGVRRNIQFVNRYLSKKEIIQYLQLSDVYMTPYLAKDQAVSGTLAYAAGYGKVIVSTPYLYAKEMLAEGRGLLADFRSASSLAQCITSVMEHPEKQAEMEQKTLALGKDMMWSHVAHRYAELFEKILEESRKGTKS